MTNRWIMLAVLFTVRTVMGIQFQSVASTSLYLIDDLAIDYTRLGMLIGLYSLPGVFLAFPGGLIGKRFGDMFLWNRFRNVPLAVRRSSNGSTYLAWSDIWPACRYYHGAPGGGSAAGKSRYRIKLTGTF
jgi:hypothetical protein